MSERKSNHPNFRLFCFLALIPIIIFLVVWFWCGFNGYGWWGWWR